VHPGAPAAGKDSIQAEPLNFPLHTQGKEAMQKALAMCQMEEIGDDPWPGSWQTNEEANCTMAGKALL